MGTKKIFTDSYNYEAFGKLLNKEGDTKNNYLFAGEQYDKESQNYYLRARYFSPTIGRFTQQDTYMGDNYDPITLHKYLYANASPSNYIDPSGNMSMLSLTMGITARSMFAGLQFYDRYLLASDIYNGKFDFSLQNMLIEMLGNRFLKTVLDNRKKANRLRKEREDYQSCKNSFDGDTLIATEDGLVPIEEIKIGDRVWAYNETNQTKSLQEVTHLIIGEGNKEFVDITLSSGEVIIATANHPFWEVNTQEWLDANKLNTSTILFDFNDKNSTIKSLKHYQKESKVYNLSVDKFHTFFVGLGWVLGHNCGSTLEANSLVDSITAKLTFSQVGKIEKYILDKGEILMDGNKAHGTFDFVVTDKLELKIGNGHYFLSGQSSSVKGAGQIYIDNGKIDFITNDSGHYKPSITNTKQIFNLFRKNSLLTEGAEIGQVL